VEAEQRDRFAFVDGEAEIVERGEGGGQRLALDERDERVFERERVVENEAFADVLDEDGWVHEGLCHQRICANLPSSRRNRYWPRMSTSTEMPSATNPPTQSSGGSSAARVVVGYQKPWWNSSTAAGSGVA